MSMRKLLQVGVVAIGLGGAFIPMMPSSEAQVTTGTDRTATADNDGVDFGWIGIFGLAGLAGLMGNRRKEEVTRHSSATSPAR